MCSFANLDPNLDLYLDPNFGQMFMNKKCFKYLLQFEAVSSTSLFFFFLFLFSFEMPSNKYVYLRQGVSNIVVLKLYTSTCSI